MFGGEYSPSSTVPVDGREDVDGLQAANIKKTKSIPVRLKIRRII